MHPLTRKKTFICLLTVFLVSLFLIVQHNARSLSDVMPPLFLDVQLSPHSDPEVRRNFHEKAVTTVIFASQPGLSAPKSWRELLDCDKTVCLPKTPLLERCVLASASNALGGKREAMDFFKTLHTAGRLKRQSADITLCFDHTAAQKILSGHPLKMTVPSDGTSSFSLGTLSGMPCCTLDQKSLLEKGYRLPSGAALPFYPEKSAYASASPTTDTTAFFQETKNATRELNRQVFGIRQFSSADRREHISGFVLTIILLLLWSVSALHRSPSPEIRQWILFLRGCLLVWILITLFKYQLRDSLLTRMLWYGYYVFLIGLPLSLFRMVTSLDVTNTNHSHATDCLSFLFPCLLILVFTNDLTQLVFRFDLNGNWSDDYSYGPGYFVVFGYGLVLLILSLYSLIRRSIKSPRPRSIFFPVLTALVLVAYNAGYALNIPLIRESVLTVNYTLFVILFLESILRSELFPTNTHYRVLFDLSPFPMRILDQKGNCFLSSLSTPALSPIDTETILANPGKSFFKDPDTLLKSRAIKGGYAVWEEDMSQINALNTLIARELSSLRSVNALLEKESRIRKKQLSLTIQNQMYSELEHAIEEKVVRLISATDALSETCESTGDLTNISLLLCHIKRHCNLFFCLHQGNLFPAYDLAIYIDELSDIAAYSNHHALVRCSLSGDIPLRSAIVLYDFYFEVLNFSIQKTSSTLIGTLKQDGTSLCFTILSSFMFSNLRLPEKLEEEISLQGGSITVSDLEENTSVTLILPFRGGV